ncbi:MAG: M20/M25/M40 family metallo-hydrolase [Cyclobacteriaceae bacterium]|nr:M20/M25/M40 family metallo-hydrolase [Cyclobacteriaceae bacterium]UYN87153.1 MAG: M20/M25/M40 family metallo-hydrolase [Cyclobacteriaceae bacterium]
MKNFSTLFTLCLLTFTLKAQQFNESTIRKHIKILASDSLQGRGTGTEGERMAAAYIESEFKKLKLKPTGKSKNYLQTFEFKSGAHGEGAPGTAHNIVAYLNNKAANTIIIGAHYDHLGIGEFGNSLEANPAGKIHNGADDNASGVAGVLELARYFSTNKVKEKNNFLFLCFSGEELGLYGSKYFTENPTINLAQVNYMINMDMIGRLDPQTKTVVVNGTGTSPVWEPLLKKLETETLKIKTDSSGIGPSDHTSFYLKNIPVLHFFTGAHGDYHKPTDDWDKINYAGQVSVLNLIAEVINSLDKEPKLTFLTTKAKPMASRSAFKVTLGVMPSYTSDGDGVKVDGVTEGRPGQKAGILTGDIIIQMGDLTIKDIQDYMGALGKFDKGQTIPVKVKRGGEVLTFLVVF